MARLSLSTRASRLQMRLAGRDLTNAESLPKTIRTEIERFARAAGIPLAQFLGYKPSTQQRYIRAAKKGRTAPQERQRVREQAKARQREKAKPKEQPPGESVKMRQIWRIRDELKRRGVDTTKGDRTATDRLDYPDLLSDDSIRAHVSVYGETYVLKHLKDMLKAIDDKNFAVDRWHAFQASPAVPDDDERWFWYHTSAYLYYGKDELWKR